MAVQPLSRVPFRSRIAFGIIIAMGLLLAGKLFYWQIIQMDKLSKLAQVQREIDVTIPARRGTIYTHDGLPLALDLFVYTISVSPDGVGDKEEFSALLAPRLKLPREVVLAKLKQGGSKPVALYQDAPVEIGAPLLELKNRSAAKNSDLYALQIDAKPVRAYPGGSFAAHLVGFVNAERKAANGVEQYKDQDLRGVDGKMSGLAGAAHADLIQYDAPVQMPAMDGVEIILTIDSGIQRVVEAELAKAVRESRALSGTAIVMDPKTGAILGLAVFPAADLNLYFEKANEKLYANPAIGSLHEPGSVFKIITLAAALDARVVTPATTFDDNGSFAVPGHIIKNHDDLVPGKVNLIDVMRQSLNVEAAKMAVMLGADRFYQYVFGFGFGAITRVELAAEAAGEVKTPGDGRWRPLELGTNSFGQGISVTPLQMISAVAAVANRGKLMKPYVIAEMKSPSGRMTKFEPRPVRQVIRPETAQIVTRVLSEAIAGETANKALVTGYTIAGKTGTAQIPIAGTLDPNWTIASFAGYLPADDPRFVVLVKLDKPQTSQWGSQVASPVFAAIAKQIVSQTGLPPDQYRLAAR